MRPDARRLQHIRNWKKAPMGVSYVLEADDDEVLGAYTIMAVEDSEYVLIWRPDRGPFDGMRLFIGPHGEDVKNHRIAHRYESEDKAAYTASQHADNVLEQYTEAMMRSLRKEEPEKPRSLWNDLMRGVGLAASDLYDANPVLATRLHNISVAMAEHKPSE
jgi:hypothetical protein